MNRNLAAASLWKSDSRLVGEGPNSIPGAVSVRHPVLKQAQSRNVQLASALDTTFGGQADVVVDYGRAPSALRATPTNLTSGSSHNSADPVKDMFAVANGQSMKAAKKAAKKERKAAKKSARLNNRIDKYIRKHNVGEPKTRADFERIANAIDAERKMKKLRKLGVVPVNR
jgi:hypothetical protein